MVTTTKAVIFDCFGVLYPQATGAFFDRHADLFHGDTSALDALNVKIDLGQISRREFFEALEQVIKIPADNIQAEIDAELICDQNLIAYIKLLKGKFKIGLLSNAGKEEIDIIYRDKIDDIFDATAVSYETGTIKPDPEIYLTCVKRLGVKSGECIFVDDSKTNLEAAQKLGIKTVYYPAFGVIPHELLVLTD